MKALFGPQAILADDRPLDPHVTVRLADATDAACACGGASTFVLLGADRATVAPHFPELQDRVCHSWLSVFQAVCTAHSELAIRTLGDGLRKQRPTVLDGT